MFKTAITAVLVMVPIGIGLISQANVQCGDSDFSKVGGIQQQSWKRAPFIGFASLLESQVRYRLDAA
jgi:hypothetical protein